MSKGRKRNKPDFLNSDQALEWLVGNASTRSEQIRLVTLQVLIDIREELKAIRKQNATRMGVES